MLNTIFTVIANNQSSCHSCTLIEELQDISSTSLIQSHTITKSGYYCLDKDINGSFVITADNVTLDLNSHAITGGGITAESTLGTVIKNGTITHSKVGVILNNTIGAVVENIYVTQSSDIDGITSSGKGNSFKNVYIDTVATGIVSSDLCLSIDGMTIINTATTGMKFNDIRDSTIKNITIEKMGANGIECDGSCLYNTFADITISFCMGTGLYFNAGSNQHLGCDIINVAVNNSGLIGMYATTAEAFKFINCAVRNCNGNNFSCFKVDAGTNNVFEHCMAVSNGGSSISYGYQIGCDQSSMHNCVVSGLFSNANTIAFSSRGSNNELRNCFAQDVFIAPTSSNVGSAIGFYIAGYQNLLIDCQTNYIAQQGNNTGNGAFGYYLDASAVSLYGCIADACLCTASNLSTGMMASGNASNVLFIDCTAINCAGYGFQMQAKSSLIHCIANNNANGFFAFSGIGYSFQDCTATFNLGTGFSSSGALNLVAVNCYAGNNGTDFASFPTIQAIGSASPVTGVNMYK